MKFLKAKARKIFVQICLFLGRDIYDVKSGEKLGRALILSWRGKIVIIGNTHSSIVPIFLPQKRLTYWRQEIGFTCHKIPDYPNIFMEQNNNG